jgi:gliding motility-associated-like protein
LAERTISHIYKRTSENELNAPIGRFVVSLTVDFDSGCFLTDTFDLEITEGYKIKEPNAFTPNGDNINDNIKPLYAGLIEVEMGIYDAWGNRIYFETLALDSANTNKVLIGWDGTVNGTPAQSGIYLMVVKGKTATGTLVSKNAPITLLR